MLGGCGWPPQPRGFIPDGAVAKYRLNFLYTRSEDALSTDRRRLMRRTRKVLASLVSVLVTLGIAVTVHAEFMQATGHLQGKRAPPVSGLSS